MEGIEAVLFDMDGTLVDTEPVGSETMRGFLGKNNIAIGEKDWELFDKIWRRDGTTVTLEEFVTDVFSRYSTISDIKERISDFYRDYENNILFAKPLPGAHEVLPYLKERYQLALVTASTTSQVKLILERNGWEGIFDAVVSHDDFKRSKPDPESFVVAAGKLGVPQKRCVVVEDSKNGALAGKSAGMVVVGVRAGNEREQNLSAASVVIDTLDGIRDIL